MDSDLNVAKACCSNFIADMRSCLPMQITVVGLQYGQWGIENYGSSPVRVESLSFYPARLKAVLQETKEAQQRCLPPDENAMPAAFVTFRRRKCQVQPSVHPVCGPGPRRGRADNDSSAWTEEGRPLRASAMHGSL